MTITKGEKIVLISPLGELQKLGTVYEIVNFIENNNEEIAIIRDTKKRMAVASIPVNELDSYFQKESDLRKWTRWTRLVNSYGDIIGYTRSNGKRVEVKSLDGIKASASCNLVHGDVFNLEVGTQLASLRCRKKILTERLLRNIKESQEINNAIVETEDTIKELMEHYT